MNKPQNCVSPLNNLTKISIMKILFILLVGFITFHAGFTSRPPAQHLFDGKTFNGWEGDTIQTWRIRDGPWWVAL
jgi:hypothetical protein